MSSLTVGLTDVESRVKRGEIKQGYQFSFSVYNVEKTHIARDFPTTQNPGKRHDSVSQRNTPTPEQKKQLKLGKAPSNS